MRALLQERTLAAQKCGGNTWWAVDGGGVGMKGFRRRRRAPHSLAALVVAVVLMAVALPAGYQSGRSVVHLELFPAKDAKPIAVSVRENETLIRTIKELGTLAFEIRMQDRQQKTVLVIVFDADTKPHVLLGATEVPTDGKRIDSNTSPVFGIRIRRVQAAR